MNIVYLHGLSSSGCSNTANALRKLFPDDNVVTPDIPVNPSDAMVMLQELTSKLDPADTVIVGTSMGAMYAQQMSGFKRILVNPQFYVSEILSNVQGKTLPFYSSRRDGSTEFYVSADLYREFCAMERNQFHKSDPSDDVIALFGSHDITCNYADYHDHYRWSHVFDGGHRLTDAIIETTLVPIINWMRNPVWPEPEPLCFEEVRSGDVGSLNGTTDESGWFKIYRKGIGRRWFDEICAEYQAKDMEDGRKFNLSFPSLPEGVNPEDAPLVLGNRYCLPPSVEYYGGEGVMVYGLPAFEISGLKIEETR